MSILIKPVQRVNPSNKTAAKKWYFVQNSTGMVDETRVADLISDETTLNSAEALMAIRQFRKVLERLLLDGHSVKLGNWGTFSTTLNTEGSETKEAMTAKHINKVNINFQAGEDLKAAMQKANFVRLDKLGVGDGTGSGTPGGGDENPDIL